MRTLPLAMLMAATPVAFAEPAFWVTPQVGYFNYDIDRHLSDDAAVGASLEYRASQQWGVVLDGWSASTEGTTPSGQGDVDYNRVGVHGRYYLQGFEKLSPYLQFGVNHGDFQLDNDDGAETQLQAGFGMNYQLASRWAINAGYYFVNAQDSEFVDTLATVGLSYGFGDRAGSTDSDGDGVMDNRDRCPATPAGSSVDAEGCLLDGDRDGVADLYDQCPNTPAGVQVNQAGCELDGDRDGVVDRLDRCPNTPAGREVDTQGCKYVLTRTESLNLNVQFATNSNRIEGIDAQRFAEAAAFLKRYAEVEAVIEGHTDSQGNANYNQLLSERRAQAVKRVLVEQYGVDAARLQVKGLGEARPIADNETAEGRRANRRVELHLKADIQE